MKLTLTSVGAQEVAAARESVEQLRSAQSEIAVAQAHQEAVVSDRELQVQQVSAELAESQRQAADLRGHLEGTIAERDQALQCVSGMQDTVRAGTMR